MKDITKKVVILNNFVSPYVSEAIIILRDYDPRLEGKAIADAERIVSDYIEKINRQTVKPSARKKSRNKSKSVKFLIVTAVIGAIAAACHFVPMLLSI